MKSKAGLTWECELLFNRFVEDCGVTCELVTPNMLAAPFFRGKFVTLVIPTGFANPQFSRLLPALRASSDRIEEFIRRGGNFLVFGAMSTNPKSYDWLPFKITYVHEYFSTPVIVDSGSPHSSIVDDFSQEEIDCDGYFSDYEGEVLAETPDGKALMVVQEIGTGTVVVTSLHEYPSREFIKTFCSGKRETLF